MSAPQVVRAAFRLRYDFGGYQEDDAVAELAPGYGARRPEEVHARIQVLLEREYAELLDAEGGAWPFWQGTVRTVVVW